MATTGDTNSFVLLWRYLRKQVLLPLDQFSFWAYFIFAVVILGGMGLWIEVGRYLLTQDPRAEPVLTAIYTYFPAIAFASSFELVMREDDQRQVRTLAICVVVVLSLVIVVHAARLVGSSGSSLLGVFACLVAFLVWWVANGDNKNLRDVQAKVTLGDEPSAPPAGGTGGFRVE